MIHDSADKAEQSSSGLRLAARGWRHVSWLDSFYPEDLPEDWQLGFYANEFSAVLVPAGEWQANRGFASKDWCDDVAASFRFYLEWPFDTAEGEDQQYYLQQCQALGSNLGAIIMSRDLALSTQLPVYYLSADDINQQIWTPEAQGQSGIAGLSLTNTDLRVQRSWLESFADSNADLEAVLILDAEPDIQTLLDFKTLIELLGL
ncbi:MAG: hypothetical protein OEZ38_00850 [Gammaproteobacteria bacterium]|nr:hypothetical protein [Gammaproteobacteria bacterium]